MNCRKHKPVVVQDGVGRKMTVLGQEIVVKLSRSETGGDYFVFENVVPPGAHVPPHSHSQEDEILEVLEGELEVLLDGETFHASAGAVVFMPRHIVHGFANVRQTPAKGRFVVSPGANFEAFLEELSTLPANQPPEMARVLEIFDRYGLPIVTSPIS